MAHLSRRPIFRHRRNLASRLAAAAPKYLVATALILALAYITLPWTSTLALRILINQHGWGPARLRVTHISLRDLEVKDVQFANGSVVLADAHLSYSPRDLWQGRVDAIAIKGLVVTFAATENGLTLGPKPFAFSPPSPSHTVPFNHLILADSKLVLALPQNRIETAISGDLTPADGHWKGKIAAEATALQGNVDGTRALTRVAALTWQGEFAWPNAINSASEGTLDISADRIIMAEGSQLSGRGHIAFATGDSQFSLTAPDPVIINLSSLPWAEGTWRAYLANGLALEIGGGAGGPSLSWRDDKGISSAQVDLVFSAAMGSASLRGALHGKTIGKLGEIPDTVAIDELRLEANRLPTPFGEVNGAARISDVGGPVMTAQGKAHIEATFTKPTFKAVSAASLKINSEARFHVDGATLAFVPQTLTVTGTDLRTGETFAPGMAAFTLLASKDETQTLAIVLGAAGEPTLAFGLATAAHLRVEPDAESAGVTSIDIPRLRFDGFTVPARGLYDIAVEATGGTIRHPIGDIQIHPSSARFLPSRGEAHATLQLTRLMGTPSNNSIAPGLMLKFNLHSTLQLIDISANISSAKSQELGLITCQINSVDDSGHFSLDAPHLTFGDGGLAAADVFTGAFPISNLSGTVNFSVKNAWGAKTNGSARLALDNVALQASNLSVSGVSTDLYLASLFPPRSAGPQRLSAASLTAGLPFKDVYLEISLAGDDKAALSGGTSVAGGKATFGSITVPLNDPRSVILPLTLSRLRLETLLAQAQVDGLSATGSISGVLPLRVVDNMIRVENGQITSDAPGRVTYLPKSPPAALAGAGGIVLQALSNFAYDSISASVNGNLLKDLRIGMAMKGRNPDLQGGYPISFNLKLGGPIGDILRGGVTGYKLDPETIRALERNAMPGTDVNPHQP